MSHQDASVKSILFALLANFGIAVIKSVAAIVTGSGAMLAESIHSFADCGNQGLLFLGLNASKKKPDVKHPLGHGKAIYFWSFIVALMLFSMGGLFSMYEGVHKLSTHEGLQRPIIAIVVLAFSLVLEGASLYGCLSQIKKIKHGLSLWNWVGKTRNSELVVVLGEDVAALLGLSFALMAVVLSMVTGNPVYDAIGSIGIGVLLLFVSFLIALKVKSLLIGQSAEEETVRSIENFLNERPEIDEVLNLITMQLGPQILVAIKARMTASTSTQEMVHHINACEKGLKMLHPSIQWIFFEPDVQD